MLDETLPAFPSHLLPRPASLRAWPRASGPLPPAETAFAAPRHARAGLVGPSAVRRLGGRSALTARDFLLRARRYRQVRPAARRRMSGLSGRSVGSFAGSSQASSRSRPAFDHDFQGDAHRGSLTAGWRAEIKMRQACMSATTTTFTCKAIAWRPPGCPSPMRWPASPFTTWGATTRTATRFPARRSPP